MSVYCIIISKNMYYKRGRAVYPVAPKLFFKRAVVPFQKVVAGGYPIADP